MSPDPLALASALLVATYDDLYRFNRAVTMAK